MAAGLPTAILVEVEFTAGVWTDIATHVVGDSIEIRVGRESAASDIQPGTLSLTLDNADGQWTPDNPTSTRYPNWVERKRIRVRVTKGTTSYRFLGRITSIVPDFPTEPSQSRVQVTAVDLLGDLQRIGLRQWGVNAAARYDNPTMWVLDDTNAAAGAWAVADGPARLTVRRTSTAGSMDFATAGGLDVDGTEYVSMTSGRGLWHARQGFAPVTLGTVPSTCGGYFKLTEASYGTVFYLSSGALDETSGTFLLVEYTSSGIRLRTSSGTTAYVTPPDFGWLRVEVSLAVSTWSLVVTSVEDSTEVSASVAGPASMTVDRAGIGGSLTLSAARFYVDPNGLLDPAENVFVDSGSYLDFAAEVGIDGGLTFTTLPAAIGTPPRANGRTAFDVLLAIARIESGVAYHQYGADPQSIVAVSNADSRPTSVALTVDAELDASGGPILSRTVDEVVASVTVNSPRTSVTVYDSDAGDLYGSSSEDVESLVASETALAAIGQDFLARSRHNRLRVSQITVDLSTAATDLYASFFGLSLGERVRLTNLPATYFGVTYMDGYVEGWTERPGVTGYEVTFDLSPADAPPEGLWDDSTFGRWGFGDGVATNSSSATAVATSVAFQWTGGLTLSTSAGDYPMDLDWNGERVTVTAAPAGGSSPQTLTLTRGVAPTVARAHDAGEPVDIWNAARWAM